MLLLKSYFVPVSRTLMRSFSLLTIGRVPMFDAVTRQTSANFFNLKKNIHVKEPGDTLLDIHVKNILNLLRLARYPSEEALRKELINGWNRKYEKKWEDSIDNRLEILSEMKDEVYETFEQYERGDLNLAKINKWNGKMLIESIKALKIDAPVNIFEKIELMYEKILRTDPKLFSYHEYLDYWEQVNDLLVKAGIEKNEIMKYKPIAFDSVEGSVEHQIKKEIEELKNLSD